MIGCTQWSYAPYKHFFYETGDIYICRVVPYETSIHFEWLAEEGKTYSVFYREREQGEFCKAGETTGSEFDILNLKTELDYEFYVSCGEEKSRVRLARTGAYVGITVNYLHPEDDVYAFSGRCLCSPSFVQHPDGYLLASMDVFKGNMPQTLSLIFRSDDGGETWHYVSELYPCFWGKMFIHKKELYMLSCSTEYGDLLIGKSTDGGKTFGMPTVLLRGSARGVVPGVHKNPENMMYYNGRIYGTLEWGSWSAGFHAPMVMSCDENADLLNAANWHFTPPVKYDPTWPGVAQGPSTGNIEGTLVVLSDGNLYNIMRYDTSRTVPNHGLVIAYAVNTEDPDAPLTYAKTIEMPTTTAKFMIKQDSKNGLYYSIICRVHEKCTYGRNLLSLIRSADAEHWELACDIFDYRDADPQQIGFQYTDFEFDGDDIICLVRTGFNGASNFHDTNYSTFYRIKDFRKYPM